MRRTWKDREAAIEAAFRKLTPAPPTGKGTPYTALIPGMGRQILVECGFVPDNHGPDTAKNTRTELDKVASNARKLLAALEGLHQPALDVLANVYTRPPAGDLPIHLQTLAEIVEKLSIPGFVKHASRKQPPKERAEKIARIVGAHYWGITGRHPTVITKQAPAAYHCGNNNFAVGPFVELLTAIFDATGVMASAANQAGRLRHWKEAPWHTYGENATEAVIKLSF